MTWQSQVHSAKGTMGKSVCVCGGGGLQPLLAGGLPKNFITSKTIIGAFSCDLKQHLGGCES